MAKFTNTDSLRNSINEAITDAAKSKLENPYYLFNDKHASIVTYYNLNTTRTTLDSAVRSNYSEISNQSPLRFNKVNGFYLYGLTQINPNLELTDYGLEAADITGEAYILPYTVVPYPGDYFTVDQISSDHAYLFRVNGVDINTLDTGSTMYKITWTISNTDGRTGDIEAQVVKTYKFIPSNIGTNYASLVEEDSYSVAETLEGYTTALKDNFISLYYDAKIQSFSYSRINDPPFVRIYDPYMVEFIIRNGILDGATEYIYVQQQMYLPSTFGIDYDRTIYRSIEECNIKTHLGKFTANLIYVDQKLSLLYAYPLDYYYMEYGRLNTHKPTLNIFGDPGFNDKILNNEKVYQPSNPGVEALKNIIIGYFNGETVTDDQINALEHLDYASSVELFYLIPMIIYIFERTIEGLLSTDDSISSDEEASSYLTFPSTTL